MIKYADIFSGCGGLSHGFYTNPDFRGVLAVDYWNAAEKVYTYNHPNTPFEIKDMFNKEEVEDVVVKLKGECDILLGGPPCQSFSTLGKRKEGDKRDSLVETFFEVAKRVGPKVIIMENVRGITSKKHYSGLSYPDYIEEYLENEDFEFSYNSKGFLIDALDYDVPQTRIRWLLIGVRKDINSKYGLLDELESIIINRSNKKSVLTLKDAIGDLPFIEAGEGSEEIIVDNNDKTKVLFNHRAMKHSKALVERLSHVPDGGGLLDVPRELLTDHLRKMVDGKYGSGGHVKNIYGRMYWEKPSGTIIAGIDKITCGRYVHPEANRLLTPRECARIQTFPDDYRFFGSLVNQYYLIGNAVPVNISSVIAESISLAIKKFTLVNA